MNGYNPVNNANKDAYYVSINQQDVNKAFENIPKDDNFKAYHQRIYKLNQKQEPIPLAINNYLNEIATKQFPNPRQELNRQALADRICKYMRNNVP